MTSSPRSASCAASPRPTPSAGSPANERPMSGESAGGGPRPPLAGPGAESQQGSTVLALLQLQADMRKATTRTELGYFAANEVRSALRSQQVVVFGSTDGKRFSVHTVSSLISVDRTSPLVLWFESLPKALQEAGSIDKVSEFDASAFPGQFAEAAQSYPLRHMLWAPWLTPDKTLRGGMLFARAIPWSEHELKLATYLGAAFAHAWGALERPSVLTFSSRFVTRRSVAWAMAVLAGLLLFPVPMTALAPLEIGPRDTSVVTAGIEGVIKSVEVEPNAEVKAGQLLLTLNDTMLRNRAEVAEREARVADTKYKKSVQLAFVDARGRHEMAIARSELDLKLAERDYARELLGRTEIRAERDGVAFFADKRELTGKPVSVGEKLMEVANLSSREFRIDLPASDAIVLYEGARVKVFLDSDPLNPVEARLVRASYKAALREAQQFVFRLVAEAADSQSTSRLRLGMRGTAQIYSDRVPLGFYLFRRPIAAARQWLGL